MQISAYAGITVVAFFAIYLLGKKLRRKKNKKSAMPATVVLHQFFPSELSVNGSPPCLKFNGNVPSYDKDSVCKWLRFQLFQERKSTFDRVEWSRSFRFEFLHSVSDERIPSGYRFSFECHRESHCSQCPHHAGGKHLLVSMWCSIWDSVYCRRYPSRMGSGHILVSKCWKPITLRFSRYWKASIWKTQ